MSITLVVLVFRLRGLMEIWKDIKGYEGLYQVSNLGRVRSLHYRNTNEVRELFLKPHNRGYLQVELHRYGDRKMFTVHRLVALAFVDGFAKNREVNHIDENKHNNRADNLEWVTTSENVLHSAAHRKKVKTRNYPKFRPRTDNRAILQFSLDGHLIKRWVSTIEVKEKLGYSDWSIKQCCRGKRKTAYGCMWQYAT